MTTAMFWYETKVYSTTFLYPHTTRVLWTIENWRGETSGASSEADGRCSMSLSLDFRRCNRTDCM